MEVKLCRVQDLSHLHKVNYVAEEMDWRKHTTFRTTNDIATPESSPIGIAGKASWNCPPQEREIGCDHISYFVHPQGLKGLAEVVFKIKD